MVGIVNCVASSLITRIQIWELVAIISSLFLHLTPKLHEGVEKGR